VEVAGVTHVGGREENQDRFSVHGTGLAILSDGMGGHAGGALAAQLSVDAVLDQLGELASTDEESMTAAFSEANDRVRKERMERVDEQHMGATLTIAAPAAAPQEWLIGHVGDSPAFLVTQTTILRLTDDHTVAGELVRQGAISEAAGEEHPQRNVLLRAIGAEDDVTADLLPVHLDPGDAIVLMSDGVSGAVSLTDIRELVRTAGSAEDAAEALVEAAIDNETTDNATAVVIRLPGGGEGTVDERQHQRRATRADRDDERGGQDVKVMITTDGSEAAIEAAARAVTLLREGAQIVLLTVIQDREDPMETAGGIEGSALTDEEADRDFEQHLAEGKEALSRTVASIGQDVEVRLAPAGREPGHAIVEIAQETEPDLIVIGASGKNLLRRIFAGSISDYVVHHAPCPVLVIRHDH